MYDYLSEFLIHCLQNGLNIMYVQVHKDGKLLEEWKRMPVKTRLNTWSVSKGIVSCAAGIAEAEGLIDLQEKVVDIYPEYAGLNSYPNLKKVTLWHLLTMTSGLEEPMFFCDGADRYTTKNWIEYCFRNGKFVNEPGEKFLYSNHNTYILSTVIEKRAGCNLLEYLRDRLLEPMGMGNPDWTLCPMGHVHAANGLYFTIDEFSAYGNMLLNKGMVNGKQLVPRAYMEKAMSAITDLTGTPFDSESGGAYGCYFVRSKNGKLIHSDGNYGQYCYVFPEQKMVVTVMSLDSNYAAIGDYLWEDIAKRIMNE